MIPSQWYGVTGSGQAKEIRRPKRWALAMGENVIHGNRFSIEYSKRRRNPKHQAEPPEPDRNL